ncbi:L,D-transpeptidase family protein [Fulvivirga ligni]|uniref:L,D-transpeptidase family protein n=1 Tax=Fulvivirga ligni TaxID=2904246 RepID=UPI001EFF9AA5|nr:L,D-transpeptidase family protein [Fulvivirga ligni]UII20246.1 L,D-transpeptidase family protein [Fulvivirga ligni]
MFSKFLPFVVIIFVTAGSFKEEQLKYPRVRQAYEDKGQSMAQLLEDNRLSKSKIELYIRAFKLEKELELWGRNRGDAQFKLIKTYAVCNTSGALGPKRKQGDLQIPEGFYHIDRFNPSSRYYLSLGINYPNKSDKVLGLKNHLGGDIFIHGYCVTIGCLPMTNEQIKELYIFCVEATNGGQSKVPVSIFPSRLTEGEFTRLSEKYGANSAKVALWTDLKKGYDIFNKTKQLPSVGFLSSGRHEVN